MSWRFERRSENKYPCAISFLRIRFPPVRRVWRLNSGAGNHSVLEETSQMVAAASVEQGRSCFESTPLLPSGSFLPTALSDGPGLRPPLVGTSHLAGSLWSPLEGSRLIGAPQNRGWGIDRHQRAQGTRKDRLYFCILIRLWEAEGFFL